jgi:tetratricopeptide (TPR) repeat protein
MNGSKAHWRRNRPNGRLANSPVPHMRRRSAWSGPDDREVIKACGNDPLLLYNLGVLLDDMERKAEAIETYEAALRGDPGLADCHYNLALLYERLKRPKDAIRHMARYRALIGSRGHRRLRAADGARPSH